MFYLESLKERAGSLTQSVTHRYKNIPSIARVGAVTSGAGSLLSFVLACVVAADGHHGGGAALLFLMSGVTAGGTIGALEAGRTSFCSDQFHSGYDAISTDSSSDYQSTI